jgi:hypothetical protein
VSENIRLILSRQFRSKLIRRLCVPKTTYASYRLRAFSRLTACSRRCRSTCRTARTLLDREGYFVRVSRGRRDQRLQERLHPEALDLGKRPEPSIRLRAPTARPHRRLVEDLRPSIVQVRTQVAEPPHRRSIRRTRPPRPGLRIRRAVADRGWSSRTRQRGGAPPERHNPAPGGGGMKTGRGARGRIGSSKGPRVRQADRPRYR